MQIAVSEAKAKLSELVARAERGETVVLTRRGAPAVRLVAQGQPRFKEEKMTVTDRFQAKVREKLGDQRVGAAAMPNAPEPDDERWAMLESLWGAAKDRFGPRRRPQRRFPL